VITLLVEREFSIDKEFFMTQIVKSIHTTSSETVDDMILMFELEEFTILRNLYMRYRQKKIYVSDSVSF
jgi:myosin heavy subunit